ncbi:MAG TPA: hypothetical protein PK384_01870 [Candidatus Latescibacteria bacterium]|nr:hypothetical protein [Candidatus Latescibacterota bacterium]
MYRDDRNAVLSDYAGRPPHFNVRCGVAVTPARSCEPGSVIARRWRFTGPCGTLRPKGQAGVVILVLDSRLRGNDVVGVGN